MTRAGLWCQCATAGCWSAAGEGRVIVTVDRDECLLIYSVPEWERIEQQLNGFPSLHPQVRRCSG